MTSRPEPAVASQASSPHSPGRRQFLGQVSALGAASVALGTTVASTCAADSEGLPDLLPTVRLGDHRITRLILGGNPIYGYSHFNRLYSQQLREFHTPERVLELLRAATAAGINSWQNSYATRTVDDVLRCRDAGIPFHWLLLGKPDWVERPAFIEEAAAYKPIGIAPHGSSAERLHRAGKLDTLRDMLKRIRQTGVLVGLSSHSPELIRIAEQEQWDVDYYMCCCYYLTRPKDEFKEILGEVPMGEVYLPSDRERMLKRIQATTKPCLAYKVLAAGRADLSPTGVRGAFQETLESIKPTDGMIVGMFQQLGDQVAMNARIVRELCQAS